MAITINQTPQSYTPSDNPVNWVFSSDQTGQPNFYFLVSVEVGVASFVQVEQHRIYPEDLVKSHFDASVIAERYCNVQQILPLIVGTDVLNYNKVRLVISEYYGAVPVIGTTTTTSSVNVFKARLTKRNFISYLATNYIYNSNTKFLTFYPRSEKTYTNETDSLFLSFINNSLGYNFSVTTYDASNAFIDTASTFVTSTALINAIDVSKKSMVNEFPLLDFTNASYYTVSCFGSGRTMELYTIYIQDACSYSGAKTLHFLNTLGAFDSFTFNLFARESSEVQGYGYEKQFGSFVSNIYTYNLQQGSLVDYLKTTKNKLTLTSDYLTVGIQNWLAKELYSSPLVYLENDGVLERVKVTNTGYDKKVLYNDTLIQEVVEVQLENDISVNV